jgi:hypothetical protein
MLCVLLGWAVWYLTLGEMKIRQTSRPLFAMPYFLFGRLLLTPWDFRPTELRGMMGWAELILKGW